MAKGRRWKFQKYNNSFEQSFRHSLILADCDFLDKSF